MSELANLFHELGTAIDDKFGDTMFGNDLADMFTGLGDIAGFMDAYKGDLSPGIYAPLFLRTPNAAKCRSNEFLTSGVSVDCVVTEKNVFYTPAPYAAGRVVVKQSAGISIGCADGWTAIGEYCTHPDIPGAGVKAVVTFDGDTITSGGDSYNLRFNDHFTTENQSAPSPVGDGSHYIDDDTDGFNHWATIEARMGNGVYRQAAGFGDSLKVNVVWTLLDPTKYTHSNRKS
ncbi:hypothetical protein HT165_004845, partial [Salmonella enterica]|nr:hypothetical protein [Salmonella enterica]